MTTPAKGQKYKLFYCNLSEFNNIQTKDNNTIYFVFENNQSIFSIYLGDNSLKKDVSIDQINDILNEYAPFERIDNFNNNKEYKQGHVYWTESTEEFGAIDVIQFAVQNVQPGNSTDGAFISLLTDKDKQQIIDNTISINNYLDIGDKAVEEVWVVDNLNKLPTVGLIDAKLGKEITTINAKILQVQNNSLEKTTWNTFLEEYNEFSSSVGSENDRITALETNVEDLQAYKSTTTSLQEVVFNNSSNIGLLVNNLVTLQNKVKTLEENTISGLNDQITTINSNIISLNTVVENAATKTQVESISTTVTNLSTQMTTIQNNIQNLDILYKGTTAPTETNKLWIDTSVGNGIIKYHNGTSWIAVSAVWS